MTNKFGFGGYVVVEGSLPQVLFRTAHFVVGLLTFMVSVILLLRAARLSYVKGEAFQEIDTLREPLLQGKQLSLSGGVR